ncbi:CopL family metal-binding regulatory protein [Luteimonas salinilitoris]|uniref:CopL family metal-binding regulatory protein n=1 Tax=Luteimonas salinilitoris TaxID=3237697 RepID=A0ABV4HT59_9GAMM
MPARSVLLQLFLIVALLVDGMGVAAASMHLNHSTAVASDASTDGAPPPGAEVKKPCHDQGTDGSAPLEKHAHSAGGSPGEDEPQSPGDCCESGDCRCTCMHHCQAAVVAVALDAPTPEHDESVRPMSSAHASPALPHLIRPPIG